MNIKEVANKYRLTHWCQLFAERTAGETIDKFCERKGISRPQFFYWQRKLRKAACNELASKETEQLPVPSGWGVCSEVSDESQGGTIVIEIGKFRMSVSENTNPELLAKTCKVLTTLC